MSDPAYPCESFPDHRDDCTTKYFGLTKRELFAAMAMQGFCSNPDTSAHASGAGKTPAETRTAYAKSAVDMADKLLAALGSP
jgi:hypothetical protein